ncbi:MAG: hypothetical protein ACE5MH_09670 [Terriglobia bacterium]
MTYTVNQQSADATKNITVAKPTSLFLVVPGSTVAASCQAGQAGPQRQVEWQVRDQFGRDIQFSGMPVSDVGDFIITSENCSVGEVETGSFTTNFVGRFPDTYHMCSPVCGSNQACQLNADQIWTVNGFRLSGDIKSLVFTCTEITVNGQ